MADSFLFLYTANKDEFISAAAISQGGCKYVITGS